MVCSKYRQVIVPLLYLWREDVESVIAKQVGQFLASFGRPCTDREFGQARDVAGRVPGKFVDLIGHVDLIGPIVRSHPPGMDG